MKSFITKIIDSWRVTIPKNEREELDLKVGDIVEVQVRKIKLEVA